MRLHSNKYCAGCHWDNASGLLYSPAYALHTQTDCVFQPPLPGELGLVVPAGCTQPSLPRELLVHTVYRVSPLLGPYGFLHNKILNHQEQCGSWLQIRIIRVTRKKILLARLYS